MGSNESGKFLINIDLQKERNAATFNPEDLALWWWGGRQSLNERRALEKHFFDDPEFDDPVHITYFSYKDLYEYTIAKATKFVTKLRKWVTTYDSDDSKSFTIKRIYQIRFHISGPLGAGLFPQSFPFRLHYSMFVPTLLNQCDDEQRSEWLHRAWHMDGIIGSYAQTELGHGSFIRGLETRADYDAENEEFILNSQTLTAYKWWPGGVGQTANMVIALAQLYIKDKHYGLQAFLVRIRNEKTHMPEKGIDVGDIGTRLGGNGVNNGFLGFHNVRIPRKQMLMRYAKVLADGTFIKSAEPLLLYNSMVLVRVMVVRDVMYHLLQAATIATRYSAVRRQSPIEPDCPEPQILDHITQQGKILPQIAKGVCFRAAAENVWKFYESTMDDVEKGNHNHLSELHSLSCCLKAITTEEGSEGIEILRKACGGQGFLASANFQQIYGLATAAYTYEGEYTVLLLQVARYLIRQYVACVKQENLPKSVKYFENQDILEWTERNLFKTVVRALEITAATKVRRVWLHQRMLRVKENISEATAANRSSLRLVNAAASHGRAFIARINYDHLKRLKTTVKPELYDVLAKLKELYVYDLFLRNLGEILRCNTIITNIKVSHVENRYEELLEALRPNAVAIVDGFDFHDRVLASTLGCYDGRVYDRLMAAARNNPLNFENVNETFETHLKPYMRNKL